MAGMQGMTPIKLAEVCGGTYFGPEKEGNQEISCLVTDNRTMEAGGMFVAIKGNKVDANRFIPSAYEDGALCCMSENAPEVQGNMPVQEKPYIQVNSCLQALKDMAAYYRMQCQVFVIGVTGSVGKTTTKEMIASVLSQHYNVLKTQGNFNNELGVPLTLFRIRREHDIAVVEMGISDFGEMERLTAIARPDACVITNIGPCHLENLGDLDGVLRAKTEIFEGWSGKGRVYLNGEDEKLRGIREIDGRNPVFLGMDSQNAMYPEHTEFHGLAGTDAVFVSASAPEEISGKHNAVDSAASAYRRESKEPVRIPLHIPMPGRHMVINALTAAAIALDLGMGAAEIAKGIAAFHPVEGHGSILETKRFMIMDDCYNANPASMKAGLDVLSEVEERKAAILGDMFELGTDQERLHYEIGLYAAKRKIDLLVFVGELAKQYCLGAKSCLSDKNKNPEIYYFATLEKAQEVLPDLLKTGDAILVKASHGMHFEKIVASLQEM